LVKTDIKDMYIVTNDYISNKCCSFELSIHQIILKYCIMDFMASHKYDASLKDLHD